MKTRDLTVPVALANPAQCGVLKGGPDNLDAFLQVLHVRYTTVLQQATASLLEIPPAKNPNSIVCHTSSEMQRNLLFHGCSKHPQPATTAFSKNILFAGRKPLIMGGKSLTKSSNNLPF
jgi:hypothetical protein